MDIDRVRYFQVIAETGSLVKASQILNISQPALSKALRVLESEVGLQLVEAEGRGLRLTEEGRRFQSESKGLLDSWLQLPARLKAGGTPRALRVGTFEVFSTHFLSCLAEFVEVDNLELYEFAPGRLEQALAEGRIDIGITYLPIPKPGVEYFEVTQIRMGLFGLNRFLNRNWEELPFVVPLSPLEGTPSKVMGLDGWPDQKYPRLTKARVTLMESALELCRQGICVGYFPEFVVRLQNLAANSRSQLVELSSPIKVRERLQEVFLIKRVGVSETPTYRRIARALRSLK